MAKWKDGVIVTVKQKTKETTRVTDTLLFLIVLTFQFVSVTISN